MTDIDSNQTDFWQLSGLSDYVAIDLETTGLSPEEDSIIEIGAVKFRDGVAVEKFSKLVNPHRKLPAFITELTGIKDSDLKDAPVLEDLAESFISFIGDSDIVGQNIGFDLSFLAEAPSTAHRFVKSRTIPRTHDTNLLARFIYPCFEGYGLANLSRFFRISVKSNHRAATDAEATGELFAKFMKKAGAIPLKEISLALGFVEGTASPLANSLRYVHRALMSGYTTTAKSPDSLKGLSAGQTNIYSCEGESRPEEPVEEDRMRKLFVSTDRFEKVMPGYQIREEQIGMSVETAAAFRQDKILVVEAGTGVGKSLGYLIPALLSGGRVIITTFTKNLQDQLFNDEIPRLGELFKFGFSSALLKGRRNYLCRSKWKNWSISPERIASPFLRERAALISRWVNATGTGDIAEISAVRQGQGNGFFNLVVSEPGFCRGRRCSEVENCPLMKIRNAAQKADLLIVNHSLVMADLLSEGGILGDFGRIVFDEAHHLESVATDQFGSDLTAPALRAALERVNRLCRQGGEFWVRLTGSGLENQAASVLKMAASAGELSDSAGNLFEQVRGVFESRLTRGTVYSESFRYREGDKIHQLLSEFGAPLLDGLVPLRKSLININKDVLELEEDGLPVELLQELQAIIDQLGAILDSMQLSMSAEDPNRVYWVELPPEINRPVRLRSSPLDVSDLLVDGLWKQLNSAVLTSATMITGTGSGGFDHIFQRLGLNKIESERLTGIRFGSPFNYNKNCLVCYPTFLPSPSTDYDDHCNQVAEICADLSKSQKRGMLMLFTSYNAMRRVEKSMKNALQQNGIEVLVQGRPGGNERLVRKFRHTKGAVLMGTDALWEGIDVPGNALEMVVIPRLPFDVPNDPVVAARIDNIRDLGGQPFFDYQLPSAILRLRQGSGRLIRTSSDRGVILILDPRTVTKSYGSRFRTAIPGKVIVARRHDQLKNEITRFFNTPSNSSDPVNRVR